MMQTRFASFLVPVLIGTFLALCLLAMMAGLAHADTGAPSAPGWDIPNWALALLIVVHAALSWLAPRTRTTLDDEARDFLSEILGHVRQPNAKPAQDPPRPPPSSVAGVIGGSLFIAMVGAALVALVLTSCATVERAGSAGKVAALECGKPELATAAALVARWAVDDAIAGEVQWGKHETDATAFGLGVVTCAYAEVRRAWKAKPQPQALALAAQPDPLAAADAGLERLRAKLGGAQIKLVVVRPVLTGSDVGDSTPTRSSYPARLP